MPVADASLPVFNEKDKKRARIWRDGFSGLLLHEIGHVVAASTYGKIAAEYVIIRNQSTSSAYYDESHRIRLNSDRNLNLKILAGGLSAERLVTGDFRTFRAEQDIERMMSMLGRTMPRSEAQTKAEMQRYISLSSANLPMLKSAYESTAAAINSGKFVVGGWHVIPYRVFGSAIKVNFRGDVAMRWRTRKPERAQQILQEFLDRLQPSGIVKGGSGV